MSHPLDGSAMRVVRAIDHFKKVDRELDALPLHAKSVGFRSELDQDGHSMRILIDSIPVWPDHWAIYISESLFNLRCALDYLAHELARWNLRQNGDNRDPDKRTQYPIALTSEEFWGVNARRTGLRRQHRDLHPDHVAFIERHQPYNSPQVLEYRSAIVNGAAPTQANIDRRTEMQSLMLLRRLNDADKHRGLSVATQQGHVQRLWGGGFVQTDCEIQGSLLMTPNMGDQFQTDAVWMEFDVRVTGDNPKVDVPGAIEPTVSYGGVAIRDHIGGLAGFMSLVCTHFAPILGDAKQAGRALSVVMEGGIVQFPP